MQKEYPFRIVPSDDASGRYTLERHGPERNSWERVAIVSTQEEAIEKIKHILSAPLYYDVEQSKFVRVE